MELKNELQQPWSNVFTAADFARIIFAPDIEINNPQRKSNQFHPLDIIYINSYDPDTKEWVRMPSIALYAKYLGDKSEWSDIRDITFTAIDIISILTSGYVIKAGVTGAARIIAYIDIAISAIDLGILTPEIKNKLNKTPSGKWLVEHWPIIALCASVGTISYYLAKGILKHGPAARRALGNEDTVAKKLDEVIEESRWVADNIEGAGIYGGRILSPEDLDGWAVFLKKNSKTNLEKVEKFDEPHILAQFDPNTNTVQYMEGVTEYLIAHESFHAEEMFKIGFNKYVKDAPAKGVKEKFYTKENLIRRYYRERYVYQSLLKNAEKYGLNGQEIWHTKAYFYEIEFSLLDKKIKIPK